MQKRKYQYHFAVCGFAQTTKDTNSLFMGCLSERYLKELRSEMPEVDKFYGKFNYNDILTDLGQDYRADLRLERTLTTPNHYAYIKISEGCSRTCSYCAIPIITESIVRGRWRILRMK